MTAPQPFPIGCAVDGSSPGIVPLEVEGFGGTSISVRVRPARRPVPVMLVHGFGSSAKANWSATGWSTSLGKAGISSVTVDVRGHGLSAKPHEPHSYSLPILLTDLRKVLAALPAVLGPIPMVDLIGYSMGGRLVAELTADTTGRRIDVEPGRWATGIPAIRRVVIGGYDGRPLFEGIDLAEFEAAMAGGSGPESQSRQVAAIAVANPRNDLAALSALVQGLSADRSYLPARAVGVPTLVVAGDRDEITDSSSRWAAGLPDGRHLVLPGRNHISAVTSAVFRSAATDFLTA